MKRTPEQIYDEWLVIRAQGGEREALAELFQRWEKRVSRFVERLADYSNVHDITQEVWLSIARGLSRLDDPTLFRYWVYRIARHKCADAVRERQAQRQHLHSPDHEDELIAHPSEVGSSEERSTRDESIAHLRAAVRQLKGEDRAMLHLRYVEEMSVPMIAAILDCPQGTVKSRLHALRNELKTMIESNSGDSERSASDERSV